MFVVYLGVSIYAITAVSLLIAALVIPALESLKASETAQVVAFVGILILAFVLLVPIMMENATSEVQEGTNFIGGITGVRFVALSLVVLAGWLAYRFLLQKPGAPE